MMIHSKHCGHQPDGRRLYFKGGGGGDGGAAQAEADRQARIRAATDEINKVFNNQQQQTATRYVQAPQSGGGGWNAVGPTIMSNVIPGASSPQTLSEQDYAKQEALYNQAKAKSQAAQQTQGKTGFFGSAGLLGVNQSTAGLSPEEKNALDTFDPSRWKAENYTTWVDGDPAKSREKMYADQRSAVYDLNTGEVNRQAEEAARNTRFGLARTGLAGGSADIDGMAEINRRTNEGLLRAGGIADQSAADLRTADEQTRSSLLSLAQSGIDTGSASTMALNGLKVNADNVAAQRSGSSIGSLFNDLSQAYLANQYTKGASSAYNPYGGQWSAGPSSPGKSYAGS